MTEAGEFEYRVDEWHDWRSIPLPKYWREDDFEYLAELAMEDDFNRCDGWEKDQTQFPMWIEVRSSAGHAKVHIEREYEPSFVSIDVEVSPDMPRWQSTPQTDTAQEGDNTQRGPTDSAEAAK